MELGGELGLIGMQIQMRRDDKKVILTQPKHVSRIIDAFQVTKGSPRPVLVKLMGEDDESPMLKNQTEFMSKCSMLMFVLQWTYPEIRPAMVKLSTKYNKATELDMEKAQRGMEYIYASKDMHCLVLAPKSLKMISVVDASYAKHVDGKSHSDEDEGFKSNISCNFAFVSSKGQW